MNIKQRNELLQTFANDNSVAKGGHIRVEISDYGTGYKPYIGYPGFKFEDGQILSQIVDGASNFLWWAMREGYEIKRKRKVKAK